MSGNTNIITPSLGDAPDPVDAAKPAAGTFEVAYETVTTTDPANATKATAAMRNEKVAFNEKDTDKKARGDQLERPASKCGCSCDINCNCKCSCACQEHCVCRIRPCDGKCGTRTSRNLVISIDGTSNQFGTHNTNVVELHSQILTSESQAKYYNSGIGQQYTGFGICTEFQRKPSQGLSVAFSYISDWRQDIFLWFLPGCTSGPSIGRHDSNCISHCVCEMLLLQVIVHQVGLVEAGNEDLIPLSVAQSLEGLLLILECSAYEIYLERHKGEPTDDAKEIAENFKKTFSREVRIHFLGAWDTVSSVGVFQGKPLPLTSSARHICIFRHALALDERRVKFVPEYVDHDTRSVAGAYPVDVKEVWFAGTHSDIGGGIKKNLKLNLSSVPLLWMKNEASSAGLRLDPQPTGGAWNMGDLKKDDVHESLTSAWQPLEYLPLSRLSLKKPQGVTMIPHLGAGRVIIPGQRIHISVAFKSKGYVPRATFLEANNIQWESFVGKELETGTFDWAPKLGNLVEMDLFDASFTLEAIQELEKIWATEEPSENDGKAQIESYWVNRLAFMALSGQLAANYLSSHRHSRTKIHVVVELFQKLQKQNPGTFDADVAALLDHKASLFVAAKEVDDALDAYRAAETIRLNIARANRASAQAIETLANCIGKLYKPSQLNLSSDDLLSIQQVVQSPQKILPGDPNQSLANSLHSVGVVLYYLGHNEAEMHADEEAVRLRRKLAETDPRIIKDLAKSLRNLAVDLRAATHYEDALRADEEAVEIRRELAKMDPTITKDLAHSLNNLGVDLRNVGRHKDAVAADEEAVELHRKLSETDPSATEDLALSLNNLAFDLRAVTCYEEAVAADEEAVALRCKLAEKDPTVTEDLAHSLNNLGVDLQNVGRHKYAVAVDEEAIELRRKLAKIDPSITRDLALTLHNLAFNLRALNHHEDAVHANEEAVELHRRLAETDPTITKDLARSLYRLASDLRAVTRYEDAMHADEEAVELHRKLAETDPSITKNLAWSLHNLSVDLRALGRQEDALQVDEEVVALWHKLAETDPTVTNDSAKSLSNLAFDLRTLGNQEDALRADEEAVALRRKLAETDPTITKDLAWSLHNLGVDLSALSCHKEALEASEEAVGLYRKVAETDPTITKNFAESLHNLGVDLRAVARHEDAVHADEEAVKLRRKLAETDPTITKDLATSLEGLGFDLRCVGRYEAALEASEEAVGLYCKVVETDSIILGDALPRAQQNLGFNLSAVNRHEDAVRVNQEAVELYEKVAEPTVEMELEYASTLNSLAASLRAVGHYEDGLQAQEQGDSIYRRLGETNPSDTARSIHSHAVDYRTIGLHEDALRGEESAIELYRKVVPTEPALIRDLAEALKLCGEDLRALGREEDAAHTDAELLALRSMPSEGGPSSAADTSVESQSLLAKTPATEAQIEEAARNEAETDTAGESQRLPATTPAINEAEEAGANEAERDTAGESQSLRPVIHGATIEEAGGNAAEKHAAVESQSLPDALETSIHEASTEELEAGENEGKKDATGESQSLPADATRTTDEAFVKEAGGNKTERAGHEQDPA
ncbi:hypothetical protein FB451DRAFT_166695 [Mycena latifolia]|nr:hypothetical protein FB451DRAFT_166695 [Mycena latifolia]